MGNEHIHNHSQDNDNKSRQPSFDDSISTTETMSPLPLVSIRSMSATTAKSKSHHRRQSSLLFIDNGITGKYISSRICKIAAKFWQNEIETLKMDQQLEIACSVFFSMLSSNKEMKKVMKRNLNDNKQLENASLRYLFMIGWYIRHLTTDNIDLYQLLLKLGKLHQTMGINIKHFPPMLSAMHESFTYYFENKYSIEVQYAIDEIFVLAAQIMTGQNIKCSPILMDMNEQFTAENVPFLLNLKACLKSNTGRQYLYRYLAQTWCDEMAIWLQLLSRFKKLVSDKERFMVAREITKVCIRNKATFALNLSYETRQKALMEMDKLEKMFAAKKSFKIGVDFYSQVEIEINKLIRDNHWNRFVEGIEILHSKSGNVE